MKIGDTENVKNKKEDEKKHIAPSKLEHERKLRGINSRAKLAELLAEKNGESVSVSGIRLWEREGWPIERYNDLIAVLQMNRRQAATRLFLTDDEKRTITRAERRNK